MANGEAAKARSAETIIALARPVFLAELPPLAGRTIMGMRILGACGRLGRDPLSELALRFDSIGAAKAMLQCAETIARYWPDNITVYRPCAPVLSPDEMTIGRMMVLASNGERASFGALLEGFVRHSRHADLFAASAAAIAGADIVHR